MSNLFYAFSFSIFFFYPLIVQVIYFEFLKQWLFTRFFYSKIFELLNFSHRYLAIFLVERNAVFVYSLIAFFV